MSSPSVARSARDSSRCMMSFCCPGAKLIQALLHAWCHSAASASESQTTTTVGQSTSSQKVQESIRLEPSGDGTYSVGSSGLGPSNTLTVALSTV